MVAATAETGLSKIGGSVMSTVVQGSVNRAAMALLLGWLSDEELARAAATEPRTEPGRVWAHLASLELAHRAAFRK